VSTPFLLGLVFFGALAIWYFRAHAARESKRAATESKARNRAVRSAQSVNAALKGRR
jgi:hypothetical protein